MDNKSQEKEIPISKESIENTINMLQTLVDHTEKLGELTKEEVSSIDDKNPIYSGLFICPKPDRKAKEADPENHGLLPNELEDAVKQSMQNGATGICLFTPTRMTDAHWTVLQDVIHKDFTKE